MNDIPETTAESREEWRTWLREHHARCKAAWLIFFRKETGKPTIRYGEAVEEALCFGWIDGIKRRIDDQRYAYRFTPRRPGSRWSPLNIRRAEEMIRDGRMTEAGRKAFANRREYDRATTRKRQAKAPSLTPELEKTLKRHRRAWANLQALAPGYRKQYVLWLTTAKKPETRERRLAEAIEKLSRNENLGMK